ncbi:MAG: protein translocase subunit SecF [Robiginitomaculum sp.]|nr:MAG: protein translocase subunit SecF [Robiginitomaculum sp.]
MAFALSQYIPLGTKIRFVQQRFIAFSLSGLAVAVSIAAFLILGLNFGIDFRGGSQIQIATQGPADLTRIRSVVSDLELGDVQVQNFGSDSIVRIRIERQAGEGIEGANAQQSAIAIVKKALDANFEGITYRATSVISPKVSGELVNAGIFAVGGALFFMLIYIWFRFEWQFSVGAVVALAHDVILTIGMFSISRLEFNLSIIAAILTIVGYSMNDTVVVYDRIRENLRKYKRMPLMDVLNQSINETLSRTTITSLTTLLALFALFFLGGEVLRGFSFAMIWGVVVGTYSSIFVAAPILLVLGVNRGEFEE